MRLYLRKNFRLLLLFIVIKWCLTYTINDSNVISVGVIGGGIGSAAFIHYMKQIQLSLKSTQKRLIIDVYEQKSHLGGRLQTVSVPEHNLLFEVGCPHFTSSDKLLLELMTINNLNLTIKKIDHKFHQKYAIFDMKHKLKHMRTHSYFHSFLNYGLQNTFHFHSILSSFRNKFSKIYPFLEKSEKTFLSLTDMLLYLDLLKETQTDCEDYFHSYFQKQNEFQEFVEILDIYLLSLLRMTIGQHTHVHSFACLYPIMKLLTADYYWSVKQGNQKLVQRIFEIYSDSISDMFSVSIHLKHKITQIVWNNKTKKYKLLYNVLMDDRTNIPISAAKTIDYQRRRVFVDEQCIAKEYDFIVIGTPLELASIRKSNDWKCKMPLTQYPSIYVTIVYYTSDVNGNELKFNAKYFNCTEEEINVDEILMASFNHELPWFNILQKIRVGKNGMVSYFYKIYSMNPMIPAHIQHFFDKNGNEEHLHVHRFRTYQSPKFPHAILDSGMKPVIVDEKERIFYLNAMESLAVSAELSVINAKNVAKYISIGMKN